MASGADTQTDRHIHTHTHTYRRANQSNFKKPGARGLRPRAPGLKILIRQNFTKATYQSVHFYSRTGTGTNAALYFCKAEIYIHCKKISCFMVYLLNTHAVVIVIYSYSTNVYHRNKNVQKHRRKEYVNLHTL